MKRYELRNRLKHIWRGLKTGPQPVVVYADELMDLIIRLDMGEEIVND